MTSSGDTGQVTGTPDKDYNLLWFTQTCLDNALRLQTYIQDAEQGGDSELAQLFTRAQEHSRQGAQAGKALLGSRLSAAQGG